MSVANLTHQEKKMAFHVTNSSNLACEGGSAYM